MNEAIKKARARLDEVIERGEKVLATDTRTQTGMGHYLGDAAGFTHWRLDAMTSLRWLNPGGQFEQEFHAMDAKGGWYSPPQKLRDQIAVMRSLRENFDGGHLADVRGLVRAEVLADFLEQADRLFEEGSWQVVPVIVGAVLEDHLRKLCGKYPGIVLPERPGIDLMNNELKKAGEYNSIRHKQILGWAGIRNSSAHGKFEEFNKGQAEGMLRDVPSFLVDQTT